MIACGFVYAWNLTGLITLHLKYFPYFRSHVNRGNRKRPTKKLGSISSFAVLKHRDGRCHETGLCYEMVGPDNGGQSGSSSGCSCPGCSRAPTRTLKKAVLRGRDSAGPSYGGPGRMVPLTVVMTHGALSRRPAGSIYTAPRQASLWSRGRSAALFLKRRYRR